MRQLLIIYDVNQVVNDDATRANMFNAFSASNCEDDNEIIPETPNVALNNASRDSIDFNPVLGITFTKKK